MHWKDRIVSFSNSKKRVVWVRDHGCCQYCGRQLTWHEKTIDHVVPRSKGGSNRTWNLVISCFSCNQDKADEFPNDRIMKLVKMRKRAHEMYIMFLRSRHSDHMALYNG